MDSKRLPTLPMMLGALASGLVTVALIEFIHKKSRVKQDAAIGALLSRPTISTAAESVGIGEATLRRWYRRGLTRPLI